VIRTAGFVNPAGAEGDRKCSGPQDLSTLREGTGSERKCSGPQDLSILRERKCSGPQDLSILRERRGQFWIKMTSTLSATPMVTDAVSPRLSATIILVEPLTNALNITVSVFAPGKTFPTEGLLLVQV